MNFPRPWVLQDICGCWRVHDDDDIVYLTSLSQTCKFWCTVCVSMFFPNCFMLLPSDIPIFDDFSTHTQTSEAHGNEAVGLETQPHHLCVSRLPEARAFCCCFLLGGDGLDSNDSKSVTNKELLS